jgi:hypothetical protein
MDYCDTLDHYSLDDVDDSMLLVVVEDIRYDEAEVDMGDCYCVRDVLGDAVVAAEDIHNRMDDTIHTAVAVTRVAGVDNGVTMQVVNQPRYRSCYDDGFH